ncbi:MAG TPA: PKD domain-containing protein [Bacteroidales bacterium]|nr:PKD domain-containing protein [Bacteroidales bacterium]
MDIEELFRHKLENDEIIPSKQVGQILMRKLALREFMSFNPARFNIYYLGAIVAGIIVTAALILSGKDDKEAEKQIPPQTRSEISIPVPVASIEKQSVIAGAKSRNSSRIASSSERTPEVIELSKQLTERTNFDGEEKKSIDVSNILVDKKAAEITSGNKVMFSPSVLTGCVPLNVHFEQGTDEYESCLWSFGDGGSSTDRNPDWLFKNEGSYNVVLTVSNAGRSESYATTITVHPQPVADFSIYPESPVLPDDKVMFRNFSTNGVSYLWNFGDGTGSTDFEPEHKYDKYLAYSISLVARSEYGCTDTITKTDIFSSTDYYIRMPNAFIPNIGGSTGGIYSATSDEKSEIFHPVSNGVTEFSMTIHSKLGITLFETKDIYTGWDGYYKGQLCNSGVYIWKIKGRFRNGETFIQMGDVTLLKK